MSDVIWSDEDRARLEESADRLTEDVIYEKRCLTMDDRIIFIGLVTRLKTMAAKFGAVLRHEAPLWAVLRSDAQTDR